MSRGKPPRSLHVWLYGHRVARLTQPRPSRLRYQLDFTEEALDIYGEGRRVLSLSLPITRHPVVDKTGALTVTNFLNGLLPEGNLRQQVTGALGVPTTDLLSLLEAVGGDCAGAVQILPADGQRPTPRVRGLQPDELARMVADLPTYNLPEGVQLQASLAGVQDKILLTHLGDGRWGLPEQGAASTHIVKPEPVAGTVPNLIHAEDWVLHVAAEAGIPAAQTRIEVFDGRPALIVTRYDRGHQGERIHQEDLCQALGLPPEHKYETLQESQAQGSRLSRVLGRAARSAQNPTALRTALLKEVTFNVLTGNGDAHSKNYSLLIGRRGEVTLAPLYDTAPVMLMNPLFKNTGQVIAGKTRIGDIRAEDLAAEAVTWGLPKRLAERAVAETVEAVREAIEAVPAPEQLRNVRHALDEFWTRTCWASAAAP